MNFNLAFLRSSLSFLMLLALVNAHAAPVFKVSKNGDTVFIGGTFHLLTEKDYPLPEAFESAYQQANELYFETNIGEIDKPAFHQKALKVMLYSNGQTLDKGLNKNTYARFVEYATSRQIDPMQLNALNPTGVMLTISILELQARGFVAQGVDKYYYDKARQDNKNIGWFETPDEQLAIIDGFDTDDPNALINYTLDDIENFDASVTQLHDSWRQGDMDTLAMLGIEGFDEYPELYDLILVARNNNWMKAIEAMFDDEGTELVLVGALHLPGKDGVLTQLQNKGYTVEKLTQKAD